MTQLTSDLASLASAFASVTSSRASQSSSTSSTDASIKRCMYVLLSRPAAPVPREGPGVLREQDGGRDAVRDS